MFTVRQLKYFNALATTGNFRAAAEHVGISQPALSIQIAEMEKIAGAPLFERSPRNIILTPVARQLLKPIKQILNQLSGLEEIVQDNVPHTNFNIKLGIIPTVAPYLIPSFLDHLENHNTNVTVEICEAQTNFLIEQLSNGELDAAIAAKPFKAENVSCKKIFNDPFYLAASKDNQRYQNNSVSSKDIECNELIILNEGHCLRDQTLQACQTQKYHKEVGAISLSTLIKIVAAGNGLTLIPQIALSSENRDRILKVLPFNDLTPQREIYLFWRKRSRNNKDFETLGTMLSEIAAPILDNGKNYTSAAK